MNNKLVHIISAAMLALSVMVVSSDASATLNCSAARDTRSFNTGRALGANLVDSAWNGIGQDIDQVDQFRSLVIRTLRGVLRAVPRDTSTFALCRAQGLLVGAVDRLNAIQDEVGEFCFLEGSFWGELSAEIYCALAVALDGLGVTGIELPEPATLTCGENFEDGCAEKYESVATGSAECRPYTQGAHTPAYEENLQLQCAYVL